MKRRLGAIVAVGLLIASCGVDDSDNDSGAAPVEPAVEPAGEPAGEPADEPADESTETTTPSDEPADEDIVRGGQLRFGMSTAPEPLHPQALFASFAIQIAANIYDPLIGLDESGSLVPALATEWSSPDNGQTWVLTLRDDVEFSNGEKFNAQAVVDHMAVLTDPANECPCAEKVARIDTVEATGEYEVTFNLTDSSASFLANLADTPGYVAAPSASLDEPIGTGPFMLGEVVEGESYELTANPNYYQEGLPYLDSLLFRLIPDLETQLASVQSGEIDITTTMPNARIPQVEADDRLVRVSYGGFGNIMLIFNTERPPFDDVRARIAASKALDLETFHATFNNGAVEPATSIYHRSSWAYPGEIADYPTYDPEGAKALVDELGGLSFTLKVPAFYAEQVVPIHAMLLEAGMDVTLEQGENLAIITDYREGNFEAVYTAYSGGIDPQEFTLSYLGGARVNTSRYDNPKMNELVLEADRLTTEEERAAVYAEIAQLAAEAMPFAIINNYKDYKVTSNNVHGVEAIPDSLTRAHRIWKDDQ